ncbi:MAG TPA: bifunctional DNA-formamidopyrimidine glycosylase/DNA-(apurinic or apyrimidinic site) lyase [Vicinamibacterales bacterium]
MPELPEVEYARRQLRAVMEGMRIERVLARRSDLRYPLPPDFVARLEGQTVRALRRRAKYLLLDLSSGAVVLMHLGMSGSFRVRRSHALTTHDHVVFEMSSGAAVVFNDPRRFGFMKIVGPDDVPGDPTLGKLGPEPLGRGFNALVLARALDGRKSSLKAALSDQRVVAGLGNIYVCEALHRARLSPKRRASTLVTRSGTPRPGIHALVQAIGVVLKEAIARSHRVEGEDRFRIYDREGRRCPRRGCRGVIKRIVQTGRSTFFCPVCQR